MTDRKLLELAAKAAGIEVWFPRMSDGNGGVLEPCHVSRNGQTEEWNPLKDDGDAQRLAVQCRIAVLPYPIYEQPKHSVIAARKSLDESRTEVVEPYNGDPYAATRRAIVRAAAEIGKGIAQKACACDLPEDNYYKTEGNK